MRFDRSADLCMTSATPPICSSVTTPLLSVLFVCFFLSPCVVSFLPVVCLFRVRIVDTDISSVCPPVPCLLGLLLLQRVHIVS